MIAIVAGHRVVKPEDYVPYMEPIEARHLYNSPMYLAAMKYALKHVHESRIFILSRKHGLVRTRQPIKECWDSAMPYDARIKSSMTRIVETDARVQKILYTPQQVLALCAGAYLDIVSAVWGTRVVAPIAALPLRQALTRLQTPLPVKDLEP